MKFSNHQATNMTQQHLRVIEYITITLPESDSDTDITMTTDESLSSISTLDTQEQAFFDNTPIEFFRDTQSDRQLRKIEHLITQMTDDIWNAMATDPRDNYSVIDMSHPLDALHYINMEASIERMEHALRISRIAAYYRIGERRTERCHNKQPIQDGTLTRAKKLLADRTYQLFRHLEIYIVNTLFISITNISKLAVLEIDDIRDDLYQ